VSGPGGVAGEAEARVGVLRESSEIKGLVNRRAGGAVEGESVGFGEIARIAKGEFRTQSCLVDVRLFQFNQLVVCCLQFSQSFL
jgi:hypothetical protein